VRLLITALSGHSAADVAVDCDDDATIGDLARALATRMQLPTVQQRSGSPLGLVRATDGQGPPPPVWLRGEPLDPALPITASTLRHGAVLGVGEAVGDVLAEPMGLVELRLASGYGAGRVQRLAPGIYPLGSGPESVLRLDEPGLPDVAGWVVVDATGQVTLRPHPAILGTTRPAPQRAEPLDGPIVVMREGGGRRKRWQWLHPRRRRRDAHRELLAGAHENIDPQGDIPLLHLDRRPVTADTPWLPGVALAVGRQLLELAPVDAPDASLSPSAAGATLDYNRPPRLLPPPRVTEFSLPTEPKKPDRTPLPLAMIIAPTVLAVGMFWFTKSPYTLMFVALSPVMAMSTYTTSRRTAKRSYRDNTREYARRKRRVQEDAYASILAERSLRRRDLADPATLLVTATGPRVRLWERRPTDPDWLLARVGTADLPSDVTVRDPEREAHEGPLTWTAPDVPVAVPLAGVGVTGVAGPDAVRRAIGRWIVAQAAVLHSPADLQIVLLAGPDGAAEWSWVRWLPHVRPGDVGGPLGQVAADDDSALALIRELIATLQARIAHLGGGRQVGFAPILVVLDGARRLRLLPGVVSLLQDGPQVGIYFLCLDADQRQLPEECRAVVSMRDPRTGELRVAVTGSADVDGVRPDVVDIAWCERVARALAPIRDVSSEDLAGSLPSSSRLLTVLGIEAMDPARLAQRWGRTTRALVGEGLDGPFELDIRRDGPHGLIAGTTGSGKSELLQTIIASLAVGNRPDEMTFVLIDYKGGAAFKDCDHLPHTVGMVTDLDGHLTTRALESLAAELRRREHQLARAGAKDIEDYLAARAATAPSGEPMPRLMIIIDEFAALVAELPDFVTGLVDIARRGRSLGVHLLLATQRPAGVVSAEIKSNTNLRIALRVTDANDSQDVIESPDAATISKSTPGRAYVRLGHSSLIPFQSSRVGGRPRGAGTGAAVRMREFGWATLSTPGSGPASAGEDDMTVPTDLAALVDALVTASDLAGVQAPPSPWLPPLPGVVTLDEAAAFAGAPADPDVPPLAFGLVDVPSQQSRTAGVYDLVGAGHFCIVGAPRSGRSTALRALAGAVGRTISPRDVHVYGVDCGNNALLPLLSLPHTGAVVSRDQPERLGRLTTRLLQTIASRQQLLAERGFADLREQRAAASPDERLPYVLVLLDRWEGFVSAFENFDAGRLIDQWMQILQEGTGVGVKVVLGADRTALVGRLSALIDDKLLLKLADPADFGTIGLPLKQVPDELPPGRGFRSEGIRETQVALLVEDPAGSAQVAALHQLGRSATERAGALRGVHRPFRVDPLPTRMPLTDALTLNETPLAPGALPLAVGGDTLELLGLDPVEHGPGVIIAGPRRSGRSTALRVLAGAASDRGWPVVVITPRQSPLREHGPAFTLDSDRDEVTIAVKALHDAEHSLLVVDDLELIGLDGWLPDLITDHVTGLRDRASLVVAGGSLEDLVGVYRGPAVAVKKSRSGLLLAPQAQGDGDLFNIRLPRSATGAPMLPGRGLLVRSGQFQGVQVVWPG